MGELRQNYISVAFANRNDNYGGDLSARIARFIDYYSMYSTKHPGLFEFVICDWNPPSDRPPLREAFAWEKLGDVLHVVVPPDVHARLAKGGKRPMHDYIARNVALRRGCGKFSLVLNQDIFLSDSIFRALARRELSDRYFYRADRCDFNFEAIRNANVGDLERLAFESVFQVHRRFDANQEKPISVAASSTDVHILGTNIEPEDDFDPESGVAVSRLTALLRKDDQARSKNRKNASKGWNMQFDSPYYYRRFRLHTNAAGDFLLASRAAFEKVHGLCEATNFYMHLDSYALMQLFAAGYQQAIFCQPHRVYHADHDRSGHASIVESISWDDHEVAFSNILRGNTDYRLNDQNWGARLENLPTWRVGA